METSNIKSPETIALLRHLAQQQRIGAAAAKENAEYAPSKDVAEMYLNHSAIDARMAQELTDIADELQHFRAYATARRITGPVVTVTSEVARQVVQEVQSGKAAMEHTGSLAGNAEVTVRLVPFHDSALNEERWAIEIRHSGGEHIVTDHQLKEDAEYRYWDLAQMFGAVPPQ